MVSSGKTFEQISTRILDSLVKTFPVACASDEFYFFPHMAGTEATRGSWDDFSAESVKGIIHKISDSISELNQLASPGNNKVDPIRDLEPRQAGLNYITFSDDNKDILAEKNMLVLFLNNLRDQLGELELWRKQPSFYLTLMNAGLAQALNYDDSRWLQHRLREIPAFLEQTVQNIREAPYHWLEIGLSMIDDCKHFLDLISLENRDTELSLRAIENFETKIKGLAKGTELKIEPDCLERIYSNHMATGLKTSGISKILEDETSEMMAVMIIESEQILKKPVRHPLKPEVLIRNVYDKIGFKSGLQEDPVKIYRSEADRIRMHLIDRGILGDDHESCIPVIVEEMPSYFRAIRSASSYSIYPRYPPASGTFYVLTASCYGVPSENLNEYKMLTAHETYPGHHLLDSSRLSLKSIVRRSLEFPLFYEGWACFAEMLLSFTGYFTDPADRFILAKRRYWRAVRGQIDIGLQTKELDLESAANILREAGIPYQRAMASSKIYTLNPGYQICYTVGIRRFLDLYKKYGEADLKNFAKTALSNGEILFTDLEKVLKDIHG